MLQDIDTITA